MRYLAIVATTTTLRPSTLALRADSLIVFCEYLAAAHADVRRLPPVTPTHLEWLTARDLRWGMAR